MKLFYLVAICSVGLIPHICLSQQASDFTLVVNCESDTINQLYIGESYFLKQYRSATFLHNSASSVNHKFIFKGELLYPTAVRVFTLASPKVNTLIFIDTGYQEISLKRNDSMITMFPGSATKAGQEYLMFMKQMNITDMDKKISELKLEEYVQRYPGSYVALFAVINQTFNYKFSPAMSRIISRFNSTIKATKGLQYYLSQYVDKKKVKVMGLDNEKKENIRLNFIQPDGKYTLVEFWFTGCAACIPSMLYLKKRHREISDKIQIITICTDEEITPAALKVLKRLDLPWKNYWDYDARQFEQYITLYSYPSNVLINDKGYTVAVDIDTSEILNFISQ
ncbi:MAG: TlpA family protein disulfide reductase [Chitinophagaceae bacterium]|nr:TlpA family protein disulfide reductase [Chitinophagaceae bacterium]